MYLYIIYYIIYIYKSWVKLIALVSMNPFYYG